MSLAAPVLTSSPLEGDPLTSEEFIRRWEGTPDLRHAELIDGIVFMPSPVSNAHSDIQSTLNGWLNVYAMATPGCRPGLEGTWLMEGRSVPQPDATLRILPEFGGQSRVTGLYASGAPEFIIEVSLTSRSRDFGIKKRLYERMGVREYLIAVAGWEELYWFQLTSGGYQPLEVDADGILRSGVFPGLWLDPAAVWNLDLPRIAAVIRQGLASPEHAAFAAELTARYNPHPPTNTPR
jgi:Uma2 family endonuclease